MTPIFKLFIKKIKSIQPVYAQVLFTALSFAAMVIMSYFFTRDIVRDNLARNAKSVFSFAQTQLEADLLEPKTMLSGFSETVRDMVAHGDSSDSIRNYIKNITSYFHSNGSEIMGSVVMFGVFDTFHDEPAFIFSGDKLPDGYIPSIQPWYNLAELDNGMVLETIPYDSALSGRRVIAFTRRVLDDDNNHIGIVGMEVSVEEIGRSITKIAEDQNSYGILISQDLSIITHANLEFIGKYAYDTSIPLSIFLDDFKAGRDIVERSFTDWEGEKVVAFFKRARNGWYLGLMTLEKPFYQSLTSMANILIALGAVFAAALIAILLRIDMAKTKTNRESKHKSAFLANMSHEIRTPMNAIIGMTTIGKASPDNERKNHCFSKIEDASNHLLGVINDILDMSKIEANKFKISPSEFSFEKMLQRVVNVVNFRVDEKNLKMTVYIERPIPKILIGDEHRITQVITNLLGNAIKFTPENGSISLDARLIGEKDNVCSIQISVSDTGIGMTPEQQSRVFSSFEQAENSTTRKYGGTGLGLAISKSIVELMGGKLWVESELGLGSTFTFIINLARGETMYQGLLSPNVTMTNVRIMIIDDDKSILRYFKEILNEFNIDCDTASSGEEAIRLVEQKGHHHIYFVDWKMPGMDGIRLARELKEHNESIKSIVIMITAAEWTAIEKEARDAGVDKFLSKPLFPSQIAEAINEALGVNQEQMEEAQINIDGIFTGRCILLAEDVEINREIIKTLLEPTQIKIDIAENGKEAVRKFSEDPYKYDMIFMDVQMPEMDGYEATRQIRALNISHASTIRIIAMTANVFREDIERCMEAGMDNHIGKPIDFSEVIDKLRRYMPKIPSVARRAFI